MNLFELAVKMKFRFPSTKSDLTIEQVLDLPLQSRSGFDLDSVAKAINAELKVIGDESFVATVSPTKGALEQKLELIKTVIKERLDENAARVNKAKRDQEIEQLEGLLDVKKAQSLMALTPEEIEAKLASLRQ